MKKKIIYVFFYKVENYHLKLNFSKKKKKYMKLIT